MCNERKQKAFQKAFDLLGCFPAHTHTRTHAHTARAHSHVCAHALPHTLTHNLPASSHLNHWCGVRHDLAGEGSRAAFIHELVSHWLDQLRRLEPGDRRSRLGRRRHLTLHRQLGGARRFPHLVRHDTLVGASVLFFDLQCRKGIHVRNVFPPVSFTHELPFQVKETPIGPT